MEIILDEGAGFCFGVERAMKMTEEVARATKGRVVTIGPLIHNPQVIEELKKEGVEVAAEDAEVRNAVTIVRTHGVAPDVEKRLRRESKRLVDATCPYVKKSHQYAELLHREGYHILIVGDKNHPEIKGLLGCAGERVSVINDPHEADSLPHLPKLGVIIQTTYPIEKLQKIIAKLVGRSTELRLYNTICDYTSDRQTTTTSIARRVQLMYVIGGRNSANTNKLVDTCRQQGVETRLIEVAEEIDERDLENVQRVGITAGASTPEIRIAEVIERLEQIAAARVTP
jgi:(E)-4-hydroxy-3-methyl-but-2-enyl pyrophosphate reductase